MSASISTHTPLAGRDNSIAVDWNDDIISTHTPLAGRDEVKIVSDGANKISTHTPLAGRDGCIGVRNSPDKDFYSHAPRGARPR